MNKPAASEFHWVVDFMIRPSDKRQARLIDVVGPLMFYRLAGLWLKVIAPTARELESDEVAARRFAFPTRAIARKFRRTWGGRLDRLD